MGKNIFDSAKFGNKFKTRDGRDAYFSHTFFSKEDNEEFAVFMVPLKEKTEFNQDSINTLIVSLDGTWHTKKHESNNDIVFNEDKEIGIRCPDCKFEGFIQVSKLIDNSYFICPDCGKKIYILE